MVIVIRDLRCVVIVIRDISVVIFIRDLRRGDRCQGLETRGDRYQGL